MTWRRSRCVSSSACRGSKPRLRQECTWREVALVVLGQPERFAASDWRTFAFFDPHAAPTPAEATQITLQGERSLLHAIVTARPDQRITILAERRPGSADAFVLTVDMCPPQ